MEWLEGNLMEWMLASSMVETMGGKRVWRDKDRKVVQEGDPNGQVARAIWVERRAEEF